MQGLNWLISLYNNGINGILADEMVFNIIYSLFIWDNDTFIYIIRRRIKVKNNKNESSNNDNNNNVTIIMIIT